MMCTYGSRLAFVVSVYVQTKAIAAAALAGIQRFSVSMFFTEASQDHLYQRLGNTTE